MAQRVIVVGAGVVGLTCAVRLLEAGHRVDVVARDLPRETTSAVAAALWYPYRALPRTGSLAWSRTSYAVFDALADTDPECGVRMLPGTEVLREPQAGAVVARGGARAGASTRDVPAGWTDGWTLHDADGRHAGLPGLARRPGHRPRRHHHPAQPGRRSRRAGVVNCSGPRRPAARRRTGPSYRCAARSCTSSRSGWTGGGWTAAGRRTSSRASTTSWSAATDVEGEWSRTPSPEAADDILARAARLVPELRGARVLRHKVGLRPVRPAVRLERVGDVVHCYGHGGAGVTLSWGVADEVVTLVDNWSSRGSGLAGG